MSLIRVNEMSVRAGRLEITRLAWAFGISLSLHVFVIGTYEVGKWTGLWDLLSPSRWIQKAEELANAEKQKSREVEIPLSFVDVNPQFASSEAPKDTQFYSDRNSKAANPDPADDQNVPKIDGAQTDVLKTEDVPRKAEPLQPSPPPAPKAPEPAKPAKQTPPGDLAMIKPEMALREEQPAEEKRPRTLKEARAQNPQLPGQKMKQEGGVRRMQVAPSFDAKATPFGEYDRAVIDAIQQRWYDLLDRSNYSYDRAGKVVVQFRLNFDGRVSDMKVVESTVGDFHKLICQQAINDPAPFGRWPNDMRLVFGDSRDVQFTFLY